MLRNRIYRGRIVHKDKHCPGVYEAIVDEVLWDQVQRQLCADGIDCCAAIPRDIVSRSIGVNANLERRRRAGRIPPRGETWA